MPKKPDHMPKFCIAGRVIDGIWVYKSSEVPQGLQALYKDNAILGVYQIGAPTNGVLCDSIVLSHADYEVVLKSFLERRQKGRTRRFHADRIRQPTQTEIEKVLRERGIRH
jgi:hypothetical protein